MMDTIGKPFKRRFDLDSAASVKAWDTRGRRGDETKVGITSQRSGAEAKPNRTVFQQMKEFQDKLASIPSVTNVHVQPGVGMWVDESAGPVSEATWVVSYQGNGAAQRLLAETGQRYNQDAILLLHGVADPAVGSPSVELAFDHPISVTQRQAISQLLTAHGIGGATWFKSGGHTVLRAVAVPQWGGDNAAHLAAMREISDALVTNGLTHQTRVDHVAVDIMERAGEHSYASVLQH